MQNKELFKTLFGVEQNEIKETVIIIPFYSREIAGELKAEKISKGFLYSAGQNEKYTLVIARMGSAFTGDAILYLKDTPCKNIIFFGSCGALKETSKTKLGNLLLIEKAYQQESFTAVLEGRELKDIYFPDKTLFESFSGKSIEKAACATLGSLKLEKSYAESSGKADIEVIDMETASVFSASEHIGRKAVSLLYVTDIIESKPYYAQDIRSVTQKSAKKLYTLL